MNKIVCGFACFALGCFGLAALALGWTALMVGHHTAYTLGQVNATLNEVNRPCGKQQSCGTLADVARTLNTIRGTAGQIEIAAKHENAQLGTLDKQEAQIYSDVHSTVLGAQQLTASLTRTSEQTSADLKTLNDTIAAAQPVLEQSTALIGHGDQTLTHVDSLVQDPSIPKLLSATSDTAVQIDGTATTFNKVTAKAAAPYLNPPPKHWWGYIKPTWQTIWQLGMLAK